MSTKVIMPQMGESIFEGTITKWLKKVGERIERDEPLFEISTDKVDSEIPSPASGVLTQVLVAEGKTVQINTVVAVIDGEGADTAEPAIAETGGPLEVAAPVESPAAAATPRVLAAAEAPVSAAPAEPKPQVAAPGVPVPPPRDIRTSPLVRRIARENDVDLTQVVGTGLDGRITKEDVENFLERRMARPAAPPAPAAAPADAAKRISDEGPPPVIAAPPPTVEAPRFTGDSETIPMTPMRKSIAEHMLLSRRTSAHVSTVFEVDVTAIVGLREKHKDEFEKREGTKLTFTPFVVKALVDTVREFPVLNCSVSGDTIVYKKPINVGIAVALDTGLIVPVVKDAHLKSFTGLALAIYDLAQRARAKRLRPEEVQNGTITITNPGIYGPLFGTPIINQPQVAILGIGGIAKRPVVINDAIAIRSMVYLSLSFDHRVIDGAVADQFMAALKARLQGWSQWLD